MNAVEFLFALSAVFGSTAAWFVWTSFVYKLDNQNEDSKSHFDHNEEKVI